MGEQNGFVVVIIVAAAKLANRLPTLKWSPSYFHIKILTQTSSFEIHPKL